MLSLKEFYQQKRDLLKINKNLRCRIFKKVIKLNRKYFKPRKKLFSLKNKQKKKLFNLKKHQGIIYVRSSFNNTIVALTGLKGKVQYVKSAGSCGFQGKKKRSTKFAIMYTLNLIALAAKDQKLKRVFLFLKGFSRSRYSMLKCLKKKGLKIIGIRDITPHPHNGCRPKKLRRG